MLYQGRSGVSAHNKSSSDGVHLNYCVSDQYVLKVAYVFELIISVHQVESTCIMA